MKVHTWRRKILLKRFPTILDTTEGIQRWDSDNLYPQRVMEVLGESYSTARSVQCYADFIDGDGFEETNLNDLIVNSEGATLQDILEFIAQDKATFRGFALHFKYNLNYKISEIYPVEFMYNRLGLPDKTGKVFDIKYCNNWERDPNKTILRSTREILEYPVFNPDPAVVKQQFKKYGFSDFPGQILFWTPKQFIYPMCTFHQVLDKAQTQAEIGIFEYSSVKNRFAAGHILKYPGRFANDEEKDQFIRDLNRDFTGAENGESIIVIEAGSLEPDTELLEPLQIRNVDQLYSTTRTEVKHAIRENFAQPAEIQGVTPESGMFNQENIVNAYDYYNTITSNDRTHISKLLKNKIAPFMDMRLPSTLTFQIKPQQYIASAKKAETQAENI